MYSNDFISDQFSLLSKLMDIHGENPFKSKSYSAAAFTIDKLPIQLHTLSPSDIVATKGIGESTGRKILEILETGKLGVLDQLIALTPSGILDMLQIKGIGPKKINTIWKEMQIESLGELLYACNENRLLLYKGFGDKTQQHVKDAIEFFLSHQDQFLFAEVEAFALALKDQLQALFPEFKIELTGAIRRQLEIIRELEYVTTISGSSLKLILNDQGFELRSETNDLLVFKSGTIPVQFRLTNTEQFNQIVFETSCSEEFLAAWKKKYGTACLSSEQDYFSQNHLCYIPACLREDPAILERAGSTLPTLITTEDIKGIIHSHSNWSDGSNTLEEMTKACIDRGLEYLVISDHSKSAFYAKGLAEERVIAQHQHIDELNQKFAPFKIFKSIESDILNDGSLDYSDEYLSRFDLVIASVHSNLKMNAEKAMHRLLTAISNPYTTILGHMTGRLLLSRPGYPVNHEQIIEACKKHKVVIELNAHPRRLDIDWRFIQRATQAGVFISINPDAHSIEGFDDVRYGVLAAQKGGLTAKQNLSSFSRAEFEKFI
ncbi:MAG: helix-hairpin-helix domain-containing protein, partial [Sphingobacteriales bacterium]